MMTEESAAPMEETTQSEIRAALLKAVESKRNDWESLVDLVLRGEPRLEETWTQKQQRNAVVECVGSFQKPQARRFFDAIQETLVSICGEELFVPESAYEDDGGEDEEHLVVNDAQSALALDYLRACTILTEAYLNKRAEASSSNKTQLEEVFQVMELLHGTLFDLQSCGKSGLSIQNKITQLCELWWTQGWNDAECFVLQMLPILLARALEDSATKSDLKRLYEIREAFQVIDLEDESSSDIKALLLKTISSPLIISEGKKFLVWLFELTPLVCEIHQSIRVQIPSAKKTVLKYYGEIYFKAWKDGDETARSLIEENILQELAYSVIHVADPSLVKTLHTILEPFHINKKMKEVEALLDRLYSPILWRSLRAANPKVRINASMVLSKLFLIGGRGADLDLSLQKSVKALKSLLQDTDPRVRVAGAQTTAQIMIDYWDVLSTQDIRILLNHVVAEHASDTSSSAVRSGALNAISILLDAPQSHAVLRALLPSLGNLIHDKIERVRLACVRLLHKVKSIKGIKYYHVVPVSHLLARLVEESNPTGPVASSLTELMMNSYFPQGSSGVERVQRTLTFLKKDPIPASVFYSNLSAHMGINSVAKLIVMLLKCLVSAVQTEKSRPLGRKRRRSSGNKEDHRDEEETLIASNTSLMAALGSTICTLWDSIAEELEEEESCNQFLVEEFSTVLAEVNEHFEKKIHESNEDTKVADECQSVCSALLRCAGRMPVTAAKGLSAQVKTKLQNYIEGEDCTPHIALLCLWGMADDVAKSLSSSIVVAFHTDLTSPILGSKKRKKSSTRLKTSLKVPELPPKVAIAVLENIFGGNNPSSVAAREAILSSPAACKELEVALRAGIDQAENILLSDPLFSRNLHEEDVAFILRVCAGYGRFALHMVAAECIENEVHFTDQAKTLLDWTTEKVLSVLCSKATSMSPFRGLDLSLIAQDDSFISRSPSMGPSKRQNRSKTPERIDASFGKPLLLDESFRPSSEFSRSAAVSLLQCSLVIFTEWLAVGGGGSEIICEAAIQWCQLFQARDMTLQAEVLPFFTNLAIKLCRGNGNYALLGALLKQVEDTDATRPLVKSTITALLKSKTDNTTQKVFDTLLSISDEIFCKSDVTTTGTSEEESEEDVPLDLDEVWSHDSGCVLPALQAVIGSKKACVDFAARLVNEVSNNAINNRMKARCLWHMCDTASDQVGVKNAIRALDREKCKDNSTMSSLIKFYL